MIDAIAIMVSKLTANRIELSNSYSCLEKLLLFLVMDNRSYLEPLVIDFFEAAAWL